MAKGSGNTRIKNSNKKFAWSGTSTYEDVLYDAQRIFKKEATEGLGNFMQRKPQKVSDAEYEKLLNSGDYIEVFHGGPLQGINSMINGKYYINKDLHVSGFGYYFGYDENQVSGYAKTGGIISALVKKDSILYKKDIKDLTEERIHGAEKYLGKNTKYKNGEAMDRYEKKEYFNTSTLAASKGYKAVESSYSAIVVVDRSALIVRKNK